MNIKVLPRLILTLIILSLVMTCSSCFDMGDYSLEDETDTSKLSDHEFELYYKRYYDTFGNVSLIGQDCGTSSYTIKDSFFNKSCSEDLRSWKDSSSCVPCGEYAYFVLPVKLVKKIDSITLFLSGESGAGSKTLEIYLFKSNDWGSDFATYDVWQDELEKDEDERKKLEDYEDPDTSDALDHKTVTLTEGWTSFTANFCDKSKKDKRDPVTFKIGDNIVIMFRNNLGTGLEDGLSKVSFQCTDLIIRANDD